MFALVSRQTFYDLLVSGRVANLPSVVSNVILGVGLGILLRLYILVDIRLFVPALIGCLLYLGGCWLNDWKDWRWDGEHRKERAIPSGRLQRKTLGLLGAGALLGGLLLAASVSLGAFLSSLSIVTFVLLYTAFHKATPWAILLMGASRAGLYCLGFYSQGFDYGADSSPIGFSEAALENAPDHLWPLFPKVLGLAFFVAGLSLWARSEAKNFMSLRRRFYGIMLMLLAVVTHVYDWEREFYRHQIAAVIPFLSVLTFAIFMARRSIPKAVSLLLANISLLDLVAAWPLAATFMLLGMPQGLALVFPITAAAAFVLALILQKMIPAT